MTMAVNLTLTADQAALLAPILQQISSMASQTTQGQGQASTPLPTSQTTSVTMSIPTSPVASFSPHVNRHSFLQHVEVLLVEVMCTVQMSFSQRKQRMISLHLLKNFLR